MNSGWLFDPAELANLPAPLPVWTAIPGRVPKLHTRHVHNASGWAVLHCGHPTANYPYYVVTSAGAELVDPDTGRGFRRLELAKNFVVAMTA